MLFIDPSEEKKYSTKRLITSVINPCTYNTANI